MSNPIYGGCGNLKNGFLPDLKPFLPDLKGGGCGKGITLENRAFYQTSIPFSIKLLYIPIYGLQGIKA